MIHTVVNIEDEIKKYEGILQKQVDKAYTNFIEMDTIFQNMFIKRLKNNIQTILTDNLPHAETVHPKEKNIFEGIIDELAELQQLLDKETFSLETVLRKGLVSAKLLLEYKDVFQEGTVTFLRGFFQSYSISLE